MIDQPFRARLARFGPMISEFYSVLGLRPNHITLLAFFTAIASCVALSFGFRFSALGLWWLSRFFDGTDGLHARESGRASAFGAYFDIVLDMAAYSLMIVGFYIQHPDLTLEWLAIVILYVLCITSALALGGLEREKRVGAADNRGLKLAIGLAEGGETGIVYSVWLIVPSWVPIVAKFWIIVLALTVFARTWLARRELK